MNHPESTLPEAEHFADENDRASDIEQRSIAIAVREAQAKMKRSQEPDAAGVYEITECIECDNEIGEGRLKYSLQNTLCIHCATRAERGGR